MMVGILLLVPVGGKKVLLQVESPSLIGRGVARVKERGGRRRSASFSSLKSEAIPLCFYDIFSRATVKRR